MRSYISAWGLGVGNLLTSARTTCLALSTPTLLTGTQPVDGSGNIGFMRSQAAIYPMSYPQTISFVRYLLFEQVLHISTAPISTKDEKGFKK